MSYANVDDGLRVSDMLVTTLMLMMYGECLMLMLMMGRECPMTNGEEMARGAEPRRVLCCSVLMMWLMLPADR